MPEAAEAQGEAPELRETARDRMRGLFQGPVAWVLAIVSVAIATVAGAIVGGPVVGVVGLVLGVLLVLLVVYYVAWSLAREAFFDAYAEERSLQTGTGQATLPEATSLLMEGGRSYTERTWAGKLRGGLTGLLALWTYETEYTDAQGDTQTSNHRHTLVMTELPAARELFHGFAVERRDSPRSVDAAEDRFGNRQRMETESEALDRRAEVFIAETDDPNLARQLLSPAFIDWLANHPKALGFELSNGVLVVDLPGHMGTPEALDALCEAAAEIAGRVEKEVLETGGPATDAPASTFDPAAFVVHPPKYKRNRTPTQQLNIGMGWLTFVVAVFGGIAMGVGISDRMAEDDREAAAAQEISSAEREAESELFFVTDELLDGVKTNDTGKGADPAVIGRLSSTPPATVNEWIAYAEERGWVETTPTGAVKLTPAGEAESLSPDPGQLHGAPLSLIATTFSM